MFRLVFVYALALPDGCKDVGLPGLLPSGLRSACYLPWNLSPAYKDSFLSYTSACGHIHSNKFKHPSHVPETLHGFYKTAAVHKEEPSGL